MIESPFDFVHISTQPWIGSPDSPTGGMDVTRAYRFDPSRTEPVTYLTASGKYKGSVRFFRPFVGIQAAFNFKDGDEDITRQLLEGL